MSDYTRIYNFTIKDSLPTGNSGKVIKGTEIDNELNAVSAAIASKCESNSPNLTGTPLAPTATFGTDTTQIATTAFVQDAVDAIDYAAASQAEMEAGTESALRSMSPLRIAQAIAAQVPSSFASGTLMLFQQTSAPTGWTKQTTHNDKALRVVSGTASSGGTSAFSTVFANQTPTINVSGLSAAATTLSTAQMPSHAHSYTRNASTGSAAIGSIEFFEALTGASTQTTGAQGGGGSHTHSISGSASSSAITLNVQYVDLIIASKN